jgi:hypothetical protein
MPALLKGWKGSEKLLTRTLMTWLLPMWATCTTCWYCLSSLGWAGHWFDQPHSDPCQRCARVAPVPRKYSHFYCVDFKARGGGIYFVSRLGSRVNSAKGCNPGSITTRFSIILRTLFWFSFLFSGCAFNVLFGLVVRSSLVSDRDNKVCLIIPVNDL